MVPLRQSKSITYKIFALRQILKKTNKKQSDKYHTIYLKAAYETPIKEQLFKTMSAYEIPSKVLRLCRMIPIDSRSSMKISSDQFEPFTTSKGHRQRLLNEDKTKLMIATGTARQTLRRKQGDIVKAGSCSGEVEEKSTYLSFAIHGKNTITIEIK